MTMNQEIENCVSLYLKQQWQFQVLLDSIKLSLELDPPVNDKNESVIHSMKYRLKDPGHLAEKIERKYSSEAPITLSNLFNRVTDLAGLRILHLYQDQFPIIHEKIMSRISSKDWYFVEPPKAYTWDPETERFFKGLGIECQQKESYYTSIHYLVKLKEDSNITCEIQVRTLFEEIWGEIDHTINYPHTIESVACKEQLRVLSKLVSTGTRLADSIFRTYNDYTIQFKEDTRERKETTTIKSSNLKNKTSVTRNERVIRQYLLGKNSNWFDNVKSEMDVVNVATFLWPNGYWPFEKIAPTEKPVPGDIFAVGYGKADEVLIGTIQYAGIKLLTDVIQENENSSDIRVNNGFSDVYELRKFVNNRREVGCITLNNINVISMDEYSKLYANYEVLHTVRDNSLFILAKSPILTTK